MNRSAKSCRLRPRIVIGAIVIAVCQWMMVAQSVRAATYTDVEALYLTGKIDEAKEAAAAEVERGVWNRRWSELLIKCQLSSGEYAEALETYQAALKRYPTSLPLRTLGIEVARYNGLPDQVATEKAFIHRYLETGQLRYATADTLVAAGRFFSNNGIDARIILKSFYDRVLESDSGNLDAILATAELAIDKGDFKVAAESIAKAKRLEIQDARLETLLAIALGPTDSKAATIALATALELNPNYAPALTLKAEKEIDRELYDQAGKTIEHLLRLNPKDEKAFALKAVIAHVEGDYDREKELRQKALRHYGDNPEVDHLIGRKLSDKYRFKEGAEYQRRSLTFDADYVPATFQLAQDLLRLGDDEIGWQLADEVNRQDPYNVVAYNLMTLKDRTDGFETLAASSARQVSRDFSEPGEILIRMDPHERQVYGTAAAEILNEAKQALCEKYDLQLKRPVIVEIFPKQSDFAIRTFGLPGGEGFLGVCFGHVITANSPASGGDRPSNWKSVLWHEFCHVVTLTKTKNRMPRWLSEGISVYEEVRRDPRWGQSMTARYREMILGDDYTPIAKLSSAFLAPPSAEHLQFAYYESSLVVEFIIDNYGTDALNAILDTLGEGIPINIALAKHTDPMERLEVAFRAFARQRAEGFGPGLAFDRPEFKEGTPQEEIDLWASENPANYWARMRMARNEMSSRNYEAAANHLNYLVDHDAATGERGGVLELLAECRRELHQAGEEKVILERYLNESADALPALRRRMELAAKDDEWGTVFSAGEQALEVQPFAAGIHRELIRAATEVGEPKRAIDSLIALKELDPIDAAGLDYQLAVAFESQGEIEQAKRAVVDALLEAPRYRDALSLLNQLALPKVDRPDHQSNSQASQSNASQSDASEPEEGVAGDAMPEDAEKPDAEKADAVKPDTMPQSNTEEVVGEAKKAEGKSVVEDDADERAENETETEDPK